MIIRLKSSLIAIQRKVPVGTKMDFCISDQLVIPAVLTEVNPEGLIIGKLQNPKHKIFSVELPLPGTQLTLDSPKECKIGFRILDEILNEGVITLEDHEVDEFYLRKNMGKCPFRGRHN